MLTRSDCFMPTVDSDGGVTVSSEDEPPSSFSDSPDGQTGNNTNNGDGGNSDNAPGQTGNFTNNGNDKGSGNGKGPGGVNARCPDGCRPGNCLMSASGGYLCTQCQGNLIVNTTDGTCSCPVGKYNDLNNGYSCLDCDKGAFCPGGSYGAAEKVTCGDGMTTMGKRALNKWSCGELGPAMGSRWPFMDVH